MYIAGLTLVTSIFASYLVEVLEHPEGALPLQHERCGMRPGNGMRVLHLLHWHRVCKGRKRECEKRKKISYKIHSPDLYLVGQFPANPP